MCKLTYRMGVKREGGRESNHKKDALSVNGASNARTDGDCHGPPTHGGEFLCTFFVL